jgi:tetratricopeptide (TPR) repeat protein
MKILAMSNEKLTRVVELIRTEKANEAQKVFNEIVPAETVEYFMVKGKLEQKFQNWGKAINAYSKVIELDPDNIEARNHLQLIQNILNFWNPEMFNP